MWVWNLVPNTEGRNTGTEFETRLLGKIFLPKAE